MRRQVIDGVIISAVLVLGATHLYAQGAGGRKVIRANQAGGVTGSAVRGAKGPNGAGAAGGHGYATDGQGNAAGGSAGAVKGPGGAMGARAGTWSRSADGGVQHQSGGAVSGTRNTSAQASSGATYDGAGHADKRRLLVVVGRQSSVPHPSY